MRKAVPVRFYCSYFDHRYLPRAIAMMRSIRAFDPQARFFILALDDKCAEIVNGLQNPGIEVVPLAALEAADPELLAAKAGRTLIEYYFTCTPCFPHYLFQKYGAEMDALTYLDADLFFYADPEIIFREIGDASVAITPHRFSADRAALVHYGRFNVAWITWRNDAIGRQCLADYRNDCIAWCFDRVEGDRFADQKYLDQWPARYGSVKELDHPGINAAGWNINSHHISEIHGLPFLDDRQVVFWHFQGAKKLEDGKWLHGFDEVTVAQHPLLIDRIFLPYARHLDEIEAALHKRFRFAYDSARHIRYDTPVAATSGAAPQPAKAPAPPPPPQGAWQHVGAGWPDSLQSGWDDEAVVPVRRQQWQALAQSADMDAAGASPSEQFNTLVAAAAVQAAWLAHGDGPLSVLDWGGDIGILHHRLSRLHPALPLEYTVKEVAPLCRLGQALNPAVRFVADEAEALDRTYDLVVASAVLHYGEDWRGTLAKLAAAGKRLLVARQPVVREAASYVAQQGAYGTTFTCWILNEAELAGAFAQAGFRIASRMVSGDGAGIAGAPEQPVFHSYLLEPAEGARR